MNKNPFSLLLSLGVLCYSMFLNHHSVFAESIPSDPTHREIQFENEYVRVWKTIINPGKPLSMHRHDYNRVVVALQGGPLQVVNENGKNIKTYHWKSGKAYWLNADPPGKMHEDVNPTHTPIEVMVIEMKK